MKYLTLLLLLSGCATIPETTVCTVDYRISHGAICSTQISHEVSEMDMDQFLTFLEPKTLPDGTKHAGAMCTSADDFNAIKTALEQTCRMLGKRCSYEAKETIDSMSKMLSLEKQ